MLFWKRWRKKNRQNPSPQPDAQPGPHWSVSYTAGMHLYRRPDEDSTVRFLYPERGVDRKIVNAQGRFLHFPGIHAEAAARLKDVVGPNALKPVIRFSTYFSQTPDGRFAVDWQVQPDGRYWADEDGFGWEDDDEVILRAYVDETGHFTGPFRLHRFGDQYFDDAE